MVKFCQVSTSRLAPSVAPVVVVLGHVRAVRPRLDHAETKKHLDDYGVREAEFARRIGTSPQTVSSRKKRGLKTLPDKKVLVGVPDVTRRSYDEVLDAVLHDISYLPRDVRNHDSSTAIEQAEDSSDQVT